MNTLFEIASIIEKNTTFGVAFHVSPDGDACGSALALIQGLRSLGKEAYIISKDAIPSNLGFLPFSVEIDGENIETKNQTDIIISLDCGTLERSSCEIEDHSGLVINVDHHISNDVYGDFNYVVPTASATCEIVYDLLKELHVQLTKEMATCLYTGILTDTGSFRHSNTTSKTHDTVSDLLRYNIEHTKIHSALFDSKPFIKLKLIGKVLDKCQLLMDGKVIFLTVTNDMLKELNVDIIDTGDLVSYGLQVKDVEVSVLLKETENGAKASLRSKNDVNVQKVAGKFGGGGHVKASGITFKNETFKSAREKLLKELEKELMAK